MIWMFGCFLAGALHLNYASGLGCLDLKGGPAQVRFVDRLVCGLVHTHGPCVFLRPAQMVVGLEVRRRLAKARADKRLRSNHQLADGGVIEHLCKIVLRSNPLRLPLRWSP